jgi:hypothetical protein
MYARLLRDYRTQYRDPLRFGAGESVELGARDTDWPEFIWATDRHGRSGWAHESFLDRDHGIAIARRDYTARELDAASGERVRLIEQAGGWWWTENTRGEQGWLPARDLDIERNEASA